MVPEREQRYGPTSDMFVSYKITTRCYNPRDHDMNFAVKISSLANVVSSALLASMKHCYIMRKHSNFNEGSSRVRASVVGFIAVASFHVTQHPLPARLLFYA